MVTIFYTCKKEEEYEKRRKKKVMLQGDEFITHWPSNEPIIETYTTPLRYSPPPYDPILDSDLPYLPKPQVNIDVHVEKPEEDTLGKIMTFEVLDHIWRN